VASSLARSGSCSPRVSSVTTVTSPSPGAVTRVMTPRRWRKQRMRLLQFFSYELRQRPPAGLVGPLLLEGQQVFLQHLVERSLLRLPARIDRPRERGLYACRCLHWMSVSGSRKLRAGLV